jgi:hypothetical protein
MSTTIWAVDNTQGLVHYGFIPKGHTVSKPIYIKILHGLRDVVEKQNEHYSSFLLHHNGCARLSLLVKKYVAAMHNVKASAYQPHSAGLHYATFLFLQL